jgi:thiosulfate/3-mercaptopyruvate sulfurtransferase
LAFTTIIGTSDLAAHAADSQWAIVDCRFKLADEHWGKREYLTAHVPGAAYAHLGRDLSSPPDGTNGRHPLPDPGTLVDTFGRLGIAHGTQVVAYDQDSGMFASRLWWLLRWMGHDSVAVLDGGFAKWTSEHRPVASGDYAGQITGFTGTPRSDMTAGTADVAGLIDRRDALLVDARAPERYRGETEPLDRVAGHIPGAANYFFQHNLDEHGVFRSPDDLRMRLSNTLSGISPAQVVCYCGSGVTACHNLLALEHAGLRGARLYAGSWSEWSSDPKRAVELGAGK